MILALVVHCGCLHCSSRVVHVGCRILFQHHRQAGCRFEGEQAIELCWVKLTLRPARQVADRLVFTMRCPQGRGFHVLSKTFFISCLLSPSISSTFPSQVRISALSSRSPSAMTMDPITGRENVFSRGPSPPPHQAFQMPPPQQQQEQQPLAPPTQRETTVTANNALDTLFQNLTAPPQPQVGPQPPSVPSNPFSNQPLDVPHSGPATPASVNAGSVSSSHSGPGHASADRQNALLSLLGAVASPSTATATIPNLQSMAPPAPQQVPTPPGSAPRLPPTSSESQGKMLLEQLMSG